MCPSRAHLATGAPGSSAMRSAVPVGDVNLNSLRRSIARCDRSLILFSPNFEARFGRDRCEPHHVNAGTVPGGEYVMNKSLFASIASLLVAAAASIGAINLMGKPEPATSCCCGSCPEGCNCACDGSCKAAPAARAAPASRRNAIDHSPLERARESGPALLGPQPGRGRFLQRACAFLAASWP